VRYEGAGRYEDSAAFKRWLILLTPEDCEGWPPPRASP